MKDDNQRMDEINTNTQTQAKRQRRKRQEQLVLTELRYFRQTKDELKTIHKMEVKPVATPTLLYLEKTVNAIETALEHTRQMAGGDDRVRMLEMKYWGYGNSSHRIMQDVHVAKSTYYKWNKDFVRLVGELMGMEI